ncbi:MAG: sugar phosphate isomerase/epimerase [Phycisphaerae bacterium]|jgi:inosose dehydratase
MKNLIACRVASYGDYQERAWTHLPSLGVRFVEIPVPEPGELKALSAKLRDHGLAASSLQARCDVTAGDAVEVMRPQLEACRELGAKVCFLSAKAGSADRKEVYSRIQAIGEVADGLGVVVALETHPDLMTNGSQALETMKAINHPSVRVNFDTANVYFYNQGVTAVGELRKIVDFVAAVHLKETPGGYQEWNFPALGRGVVDFPQVFNLLNDRGFRGPFTLELEGTRGVTRTEAQQLQYVEESVAYLRRIGAMDGQS